MDELNIITDYSEYDYMKNIIKKASETQAVIICQSNSIVNNICSTATSMGIEIKEPIPIQWFKSYEKNLVIENTPIIVYKPMSIIQQLINEGDRRIHKRTQK